MTLDNAVQGTKKCPFCAEEIRLDAVKCRYCLSRLEGVRKGGGYEWRRSEEGRKIAGVCAGLAKALDIPVTSLRLGFIIATFMGGWGLLIYIILWLLMPIETFEYPKNLNPPKNDYIPHKDQNESI